MNRGYKTVILCDQASRLAAETLKYTMQIRTLDTIVVNHDIAAESALPDGQERLRKVRLVIVLSALVRPSERELAALLVPYEELLPAVPVLYVSPKPLPPPICCHQANELGDMAGLLSKARVLVKRKTGPKPMKSERLQPMYLADHYRHLA